MSTLTNSAAWLALQNHRNAFHETMRQLFANDSKRFEKFSILFDTILFDYN